MTAREPSEAADRAEQLRVIAKRIENIAFEMPAPNPYTPRLAMLAVEIRSAAYAVDATEGRGG